MRKSGVRTMTSRAMTLVTGAVAPRLRESLRIPCWSSPAIFSNAVRSSRENSWRKRRMAPVTFRRFFESDDHTA